METFGSSTIIEIYRYMADLAILTPWSIDAVCGASDYYSDAAISPEQCRKMPSKPSSLLITQK